MDRVAGSLLISLALALALTMLLSPVPLLAVQRYRLDDLGTLGGRDTHPNSINNRGQVVGYSKYSTEDGPYHAFLWEDHVMTDLGALGGVFSEAYDLNDSTRIVGITDTDDKGTGFLWRDGTMYDFGAMTGNRRNTPYGISNSGKIVGRTPAYGTNDWHAFLYANGTLNDLGTLGGPDGIAVDINENDQITGTSNIHAWGELQNRAFMWQNGTMTSLGTLGGKHSSANALNDYGHVVGFSGVTDIGSPHAFLWQDGAMTDLGTLGGFASYAYDINNTEQVVGSAQRQGGDNRAFIFQGGVMYDLNDLVVASSSASYELFDAYSVNNSGKIIGMAYLDAIYTGYILTPIPEPSSVAFLALIALATVLKRTGRLH